MTVSKEDMINSIEETMSAGLPRDAFIAQVRDELPDDVARSCDFQVDPCVNFYEFACGSWIKDTEIPPHEGKVLKSWGLTAEKVKRELRTMFEVPHYAQPEFQRLSDWYTSCMDMEQIDKVGLADLNRVLAHVDSITSMSDLQDSLTYLGVLNLQSLFTLKVSLPPGEHDRYSLYLKPSGLTLANPAIYIQESPENLQLVEDLRQHFERLHTLSGLSPAQAAAAANKTLEIEVMLAKFHAEAPSASNHGPHVASGKYALHNLEELSPLVPWRRIFAAIHDECKRLEGEHAACMKSLLGGVHNMCSPRSPSSCAFPKRWSGRRRTCGVRTCARASSTMCPRCCRRRFWTPTST